MAFGRHNSTYHTVGTENEEDGLEVKRSTSKRKGVPKIATILIVAGSICSMAILAAGVIYGLEGMTKSPASQERHLNPCGNSSAEALGRNCSFDLSTWSYFPPYCPHYANDDFVNTDPNRPWKYYVDPYKQIPLADEDWPKVLDNKLEIWGERGEHLTHCIFMFRTIGQIIQDGGRYVPKHMDFGHIHHCTEILVEAIKKDEDFYMIETHVPPISYDQDC